MAPTVIMRPRNGRFIGYTIMVATAVVLVLIFYHGGLRELAVSWYTPAGFILLARGFWLFPRLIIDDDAVTLRNNFRSVRVPWASLERVEGGYILAVHAGGKKYLSSAVDARGAWGSRDRGPGSEPRVEEQWVSGRGTHDVQADPRVAAELIRRRKSNSNKAGGRGVEVTFNTLNIAELIVGAALVTAPVWMALINP